jgi:hypothetical protein
MIKPNSLKFHDVTHFEFVGIEGRGTASASWLRHEGVYYLWKQDIFTDFLYNEVIAYEMASQLRIKSAECILAIRDGAYGIISKDVDEYGCKMRNLLEIYPQFELVEDRGYSAEAFIDKITNKNEIGMHMSYENVLNMLLFDYLIENTDRHYGNIGIDDQNGDIAPFYDNAASLSLFSENKASLLYDRENSTWVYHCDIPSYLLRTFKIYFIVYGSRFLKRCENLNIVDILLRIEGVMGRTKSEEYMDTLPDLIESRIETLRSVLQYAIKEK